MCYGTIWDRGLGRTSMDTEDVRDTARTLDGASGELSNLVASLGRASTGGLPALNFSTIGITMRISGVRNAIDRLGDDYSRYATWLRREADYWERLDGGGWHPGDPWWPIIIIPIGGLLGGILRPQWPWAGPPFLPWPPRRPFCPRPRPWPIPGGIHPRPIPLPVPRQKPVLPKPVVQGGNLNVTNAAIVEAAKNAPDRRVNCAIAVRKWLEDAGVRGAGGGTPHQAWTNGGGKLVDHAQMRPGDVIQVGNPNGSWEQRPVPHTMLVTNVHYAANGSVESFDVRESNYIDFNTVGTREHLNVGMFDRTPPRELRVYRFGQI